MKNLKSILLLFFLSGTLALSAQSDGAAGWECFTPDNLFSAGVGGDGGTGDGPTITTSSSGAAVLCADDNAIKYVNLNIHYMQRSCGSDPDNFTESDDGMGNTGYTGLNHAFDVVQAANWSMLRNWRAGLQVDPNNITPFPPKRIQYVLNGVYFHADDDYFQATGSNSQINNVYGVNVNSEYNIYMTGGSASSSGGWAIPASNAMILRQTWWNFHFPPQFDPIDGAGDIVNHELGHLWGLNHSFACSNPCNGVDINVSDECDTGCDCVTIGCGGCDNWNSGSNNMMGYNTLGNSLTPCQLETIHISLENEHSDYVAYCCSDWSFFEHPTQPLTQMVVDACRPNFCEIYDIVSTVNDCFEGCNVTYDLADAPDNVCAEWVMTVWDAEGNVVNTVSEEGMSVNEFVDVGTCFQACVTYCGSDCIPFTLCSDVEMCNSTADGPVVDFHFEHENGTTDVEFDVCEDVYLDGSTNLGVMQHGVTIWKVIGGTTVYVGYEGSLSVSSESPFNLTEVLQGMGDMQIANSQYIIKYNNYYPDCGWISTTMEYDLVETVVDFHFEHENGIADTQFSICEAVFLDGSTNQDIMQHGVTVWKTINGIETYVGYEGSITAPPTEPFNLSEVLQEMGDTPIANSTYKIKYNVYDPDCGWQFDILSFELLEAEVNFHFEHENGMEDDQFSICEDVFLDGSANQGIMQHGVTVWKTISGVEYYVGYEGSITASPTAPFNLSDVLEDMGDTPVAFSNYKIKYNVYDPDCGWQFAIRYFNLLEEQVNFHFEHENGIEDTQFNICEDVFLDGSENQGIMQHGVTVWKTINGVETYVGYEGSINASPTAPFSLTQVLQDMGDSPVINSTYKIKYNVYDPDCGWDFAILYFDLIDAPPVEFHFEDANGVEGIEFNICDDVFLDGSANPGIVQHGVTVWKTVNGVETYVGYEGSITASPTVPFNLSEVLDDMGDSPVGNSTYKIKYNVYDPDCGWRFTILYFDLLPAIVDFHFEHADGIEDTEFSICEHVFLDGSANQNIMQHGITVWQIVNGVQTYVGYEGSITAPPTAPFDLTLELLALNANLLPGTTFIIKYNVYTAACGWQSETMNFDLVGQEMDFFFAQEDMTPEDTFGPCEDVWVDGSGNVPGSAYNLTLWKVVGSNLEIQGMLQLIPGTPNFINITDVFENLQDPVVFQPGCTYRMRLEIYTENCNRIFQSHDFTLLPGALQAEGSITSWCNENGVNEVTVEVDGTTNCTVVTATDGLYSCPNTNDYIITPSKLINVWNGITTLDYAIVAMHVAGFQIFDNPYEYIAADADHDENITSDDVWEIADIVLLLATEFPNNTSWRFHDPETTINWVGGFPMIQEFIEWDVCRTGNDFIGIKIGDLNCTANTNFFTGNPDQRIAYLQNDSRTRYRRGDKVSVPLTLVQAKQILGLQLGLEYDTKVLEYLGLENIQLNKFSAKNYNDKHAGKIRLSWLSDNLPDGEKISSAKGMVNLNFIAQSDFQDISTVLFLQETLGLPSELILPDLSVERLEFENQAAEGKLANASDALNEWITVYPNPAKDQLIFNSEDHQIVEVTILNINGQLMKKLNVDHLQKGIINISDLPAGTYLLKFLDVQSNVKTEKVVKVE